VNHKHQNVGRLFAGLSSLAAACWLWWWQAQHYEYHPYAPEGMWVRLDGDSTSSWLLLGAQALSIACVVSACFVLYRRGHGGKLAIAIDCLLLAWNAIVSPTYFPESRFESVLQIAMIGLMLLYSLVIALVLPFTKSNDRPR
jgi:hypothetical protein